MMEHKIKFRGKTKDGEWVKGSYVYAHKWFGSGKAGHFITNIYGSDRVMIDEHTVGQYTGLEDKNEVEIYEGDIVEVNITKNEKAHYRVTWRNCLFVFENDVPCCTVYNVAMYVENHKEIKVIGNKWDNPELIGE